MMKRGLAHIVFAGFLFFLGCERGTPVSNDSGRTINGYRIEGRLFDEFLRPLVGVQVVLYYGLAFISGDSVSRAYTPAAQGEFVTVGVKDGAGQTVRVLFAGPAPQDSTLYIFWNERNDSGGVVRSGLYTVTYTVANVVKKTYRLIIDGNTNAVTDADGRFVIPESDLPVAEIAPYYDSTDAFVGQFQITDEVFLLFVGSSFSRVFRVPLVKDKTTNFSVVLK